MTAGLLMAIGSVVLVVGLVMIIVNFGKAAKNVMNMEVDSFAKRMISRGGLVLLGGFIWFLLEKFAK